MNGTPSRRGAVPFITMRLSLKNPVLLCVFAVFLLLCVRPAHAFLAATTYSTTASGTVTNYSCAAYGSSYGASNVSGAAACSSMANFALSYGYCGSSVTFSAGHCVLNYNGGAYDETWITPVGSSCPVNSVVSGANCVCNAGFTESAGECVANAPVLTPSQQASADAIAAAAANGSSAASQTAAGLAAAAAVTAGYTTVQAAVAGATAAAAISAGGTVLNAATAGHTAADQMAIGNTQQQAVALALAFSNADIANRAVAATLGTLPTYSDLAAATAAGLAAGAVGVVALGGAPVTASLLAAAALHAGVMAIVSTGASTGKQQAAASAGVVAAQAGGTVLQVTLAPQVVADALPAAPSSAQVSAASLAAVSAFQTQPQASWTVPPDLPTNSATAAATAAAASVAAGGSPAAAAAAGAAAASITAAGGTVAAAQSAGVAAAGVVAAGGTVAAAGVVGGQAGASKDGATESTQKGVLKTLTDFMTFGQGQAVNDNPYLSLRVAPAQTDFSNGLSALHTDAIASDSTMENSLTGVFIFDPQYAVCQPITHQVMGKTVSIDLCHYVGMLRDLLGWLFAVFGAYSIYQTIFRAKA